MLAVDREEGESVTTFERLKMMIERDCIEGTVTDFKRTYQGHWQRSAGAWAWNCTWNGRTPLGSIFRASELVKEKRLVLDPHGNISPWGPFHERMFGAGSPSSS
jgi:hypothetical protein